MISGTRARSCLRDKSRSRAITENDMEWNNYTEVYDLFINSSRVKRIFGKKHALRVAESQTGTLFSQQKVELVNIYTGEIIYHN